MRFEHKRKRSSSRITLAASLALFMVLCGAILLVVSQRLDSFGLAESTGTDVDSATQSAVERALQHIDDADRAIDEDDSESSKFHMQQAREALYEFLPAPSNTNRGGET